MHRDDGRHTECRQDVVFVIRYALSTGITAKSNHRTISELEVFTEPQVFQNIEFRVSPESITFEIVIQQNTFLVLRAQSKIKSALLSSAVESECLTENRRILCDSIVPVCTLLVCSDNSIYRTVAGVDIVKRSLCFQIDIGITNGETSLRSNFEVYRHYRLETSSELRVVEFRQRGSVIDGTASSGGVRVFRIPYRLPCPVSKVSRI